MKTKLTYIVSDVNKSLAFEWIVNSIDHNKLDLRFILLNPEKSPLEDFLIGRNVKVIRFPINSLSQKVATFFKVYRYLKNEKPDIVHCHLFNASLIGLSAAKLAGIKKRVHTRHHSTYNHQNNRKGIFFDTVINYLSTDIVAISQNVQTILEEYENVPKRKIRLIHHGFDLETFANAKKEEIEGLRSKHEITGKPVIGVIARWIEWKGIQFIIPAFKKLLKDFPQAQLVLANARGPYKSQIDHLLSEIPKENYRVISFEENIFALYHTLDVYIHTPVDSQIEAFGQTYVEALAARIPSVFTLSGVANEFIEDGKNALVVPFQDSNSIYNSIKELMIGEEMIQNLISNGRKDVMRFQLEKMISKLETLYSD